MSFLFSVNHYLGACYFESNIPVCSIVNILSIFIMISSVFLSFAVVLKVVKKGIERDKGLLTTRSQAISSILELPSVSTDVTVDANQKDWLKLKKKKSESESESKNPFQERICQNPILYRSTKHSIIINC